MQSNTGHMITLTAEQKLLAELNQRMAAVEAKLSLLTRECNLRQDGVLTLSANVHSQLLALRGRVGKIGDLLDSQEKTLFQVKRRLPPKKKSGKAPPDPEVP